MKRYPVDILPMIKKHEINTDEIMFCAALQGFHGHIVWRIDKKDFKNGKFRWRKTAQIKNFIIERQDEFWRVNNMYQVRTF